MSANAPDPGHTGNAHHGDVADYGIVVQGRDMNVNFYGQRDGAQRAGHGDIGDPPWSFVDRTDVLEAIVRDLGPRAPTRVVMCGGPRGVGKTSLVRKVAFDRHPLFPDGQLYFEYVRGMREDPDAAVEDFLRALGVPKDAVPANAEHRRSHYRNLTARKRLLVVIEGAWWAGQVRALLPRGAGSLVLVTADQSDFHELAIAPGAEFAALKPLSTEHSRELLAKRVGPGLAREDAAAVDELLGVCGGLPLALEMLGGQLNRLGPGGARALTTRIRAEGGALRAIGNERGNLHMIFHTAYTDLSPEAAGLYRTLGTWPGARIGRSVIDAAAEGAADPRPLVRELHTANLLEEDALGSLRFTHDLVRAHARERAEAEDSGNDRGPRLVRMLDAYMVVLGFAELAARGPRLRVIDLDGLLDGHQDPFRADARVARQWLLHERHTILAVVLHCHDHGLYAHCHRFAELSSALYLDQRYVHDWAMAMRAGADAARMVGDTAVEARLASLVSRPLRDVGEEKEARERILRAVELAEHLDDELLCGSVYEFYGRYLTEVDPRAAVEAFSRSLRHNEASDDPDSVRGAALAVLFRGTAWIRAGEGERAVADVEAAVRAFEDLPERDERMAARGRTELGRAYALMGRDRDAVTALKRAVAAHTEADRGYYAAEALQELAAVFGRMGAVSEQRAHLAGAEESYRELGSPRADEVAERLRELDGNSE
jgi:tetratricopeptide (TPR) repeat protein